MADSAFFTTVGWKCQGTGHILVNKANGSEMVAVIVGEIVDDHLCCGPLVNYSPRFPKPIQKTKNTFVIVHPHVPRFAEDFDWSIQTVLAVQTNITCSKDDQFFIKGTAHNNAMRFAVAAWEKQVWNYLSFSLLSDTGVVGETFDSSH